MSTINTLADPLNMMSLRSGLRPPYLKIVQLAD